MFLLPKCIQQHQWLIQSSTSSNLLNVNILFALQIKDACIQAHKIAPWYRLQDRCVYRIFFTTTEKKHSVYTCNNVFTYFCFTKENLHLVILSINFVFTLSISCTRCLAVIYDCRRIRQYILFISYILKMIKSLSPGEEFPQPHAFWHIYNLYYAINYIRA